MRDDLRPEAVLLRIKSAFRTTAESREEHFPPQSKDGVSEYWQVRKFLEPKNWDAISAEDLRAYKGDEQAVLAFLTPEGFRYYLPAFLSIALSALDTRPTLAGSVIFYLTPSEKRDEAKRDIERYAKFTSNERDAIRAWLSYVDSQKDRVQSYSLRPDVALARYWSRT